MWYRKWDTQQKKGGDTQTHVNTIHYVQNTQPMSMHIRIWSKCGKDSRYCAVNIYEQSGKKLGQTGKQERKNEQ